MFVRFHRSLLIYLAALHFAMLTLFTCFVHGLAHSLCSLLCWTVEIHEYMFTLKTRFTGTTTFVVITGNTPIERVSGNNYCCELVFKNFNQPTRG